MPRQIVDMAMHARGIRDMACVVLPVSPTSVINERKTRPLLSTRCLTRYGNQLWAHSGTPQVLPKGIPDTSQSTGTLPLVSGGPSNLHSWRNVTRITPVL